MRKIIPLIAVLALLALAGCDKNAAAPTAMDTLSPAPASDPPSVPSDAGVSSTPAPSASTSAYDEAMKAYESILERNDQLEDFLAETAKSGKNLTPSRFALLDLDGDEIPEVVIELSDDYPYFYEVLYFEDGNMYGHILPLRQFNDLKEDGTFSWSASASNSGYGSLRFSASEYVVENLAYTETGMDGENVAMSYFIGDESVTRERYDAFVAEQDDKPAAQWHSYTQEDIEEAFS